MYVLGGTFVVVNAGYMVIFFVSEVHRVMSSISSVSSTPSSIQPQPPLAISSSLTSVPVSAPASVATPSRSSSMLGTLGSLGSLGLASSASSAAESSSVAESESFLSSPIFIGITVIIALSVVGFNVFTYLGTGTDDLMSRVLKILRIITRYVSSFMNKFTDNTVTGTKGAVDVAGGTVKAGAAIPNELVNGSSTKGTVVSQQNKKKIDTTSAASAESVQPEQSKPSNNLQDKLNGATVQGQGQGQNQNQDEPGAASTKSSGPGYCYIGDDRGARSCISVSESTKCMSGDVYPNLDVCQRAP